MPQALITLNSVTGSNPPNGTALVINTAVTCNNVNTGGEVTYLWEFLDRPEGSSSAFSNPNIQNPTFTPDCEGTYLIRLTVNRTLSTESVNTVIAAITQLKSGIRIPAAGETTEESTARGWAENVNQGLQLLDNLRADPGYCTGSAAAALSRGQVVYISSMRLIKAGLPDEEYVPVFSKALAANANQMLLPLYIVQNLIDGGTSVTANSLFYARAHGICGPVSTLGGSAGDRVYVSNTGTLSLTPGANPRRVGTIAYTDGATFDWIYFDGGMVHGESTLYLEDGAALVQRTGIMNVINAATNEDINVATSGTAAITLKSSDVSLIAQDDIRLENSAFSLTVNGTGTLDLSPNTKITGVATPTSTNDAATKAYVDAAVGAVTDISGNIFWGNTATVNSNSECALDPGFGNRTAPLSASSHPQLPIAKSGVLRDLEVRAVTGPGGGTLDCTVWVNNAATSITCNLAIAGTTAADHSHSVSVVAGDYVELRVKGTGGVTSGAVDIAAMLRIAAT